MNTELAINKIGEQTMTLKEITDLLEVDHSKSMSKVAVMAESPEFGTVAVLAVVYNKHGQTTNTYELNKRQSIAVASRLNTALLMRVIDRWQELEQKALALPGNYIEALEALLVSEKEKQIAQQKVLKLEHSSAIKDDLILASNEASIKAGEIKISELVKSIDIIDIGATNFYKWLREQGYLFQDSREPIQEYVTRGYVACKTS